MNRRELLIGLAAVGCLMPGVGSSSDPYTLPELPGYPPGWQNYGGKTQVSALPINTSTAVIMLFGDSTCSNVVNSIYTPTQPTNQNFNVYNGGLYTSLEPLLGCNINSANLSSGSYFTRVADGLMAGSFNRVALVPFGVGGSLFSDYAVGGAINGRIAAAYRRVQAAGLDGGSVYWYFQCGANDKNAGTSQVSATASLTSVIATIRTVSSANIFIPKHSNFGLATSSAIQAAQAAVLDTPGKVFSGGDMDSLIVSGGNYWDNTHFNATGAAAAAALAVSAITAHP